jgi:hypothetical protein
MWRDFFSDTNTGIPTSDGETVGISFFLADATVLKVFIRSQKNTIQGMSISRMSIIHQQMFCGLMLLPPASSTTLFQADGSLDTPATSARIESETRRLIQEHALDASIVAYGSGNSRASQLVEKAGM